MNTKKKILFLVTQSEFGGAQHFIYTLVNNLKDYQIMVVAGKEGDDENGLLFKLEKNRINTRHLKYLRRGINPFFDFLGFFEIKKLMNKEKPDILFLCSSKAGFLGSLAGRLIKIPKIIYRIGGWTFNDPWPNWKKKLYIWIEKHTAKFKDYIINNAESDRQQAIKLGIKPKKEILTIYNGIDVDKTEFLNKEEARKAIHLENSDFVVGTIANDYPTKGLKYLKEVIKDFKNIKFEIIGKGNKFIPGASKYLKAFNIFVLPSVKEGFPWVVLEAMSAEIPVIATRVGAISEIIENNQNGIIVDSQNSEQIKNAINVLINDSNLRVNIAKEGKKTVIEKFGLSKMIKQYEDLFLIN